jgi:hypothetical protein
MCPPYDSEIAFLAGVDENNEVAPTSYFTWNNDHPATYGTSSTAIKWGDSTPGTPGGNVTYAFHAASNWTSSEQVVWTAEFQLWSAFANITFSQAADPSAANITIVRGTDGKAFASFGPQLTNAVGSSVVATPNSTGAVISIDTNAGSYGPLDESLKDLGGAPYWTMMQQIGHILGLGSAGPYDNATDADARQFGPYDSQLWTAMSDVAPGDVTAAYYNAYPVSDTNWGSIEQDGTVYANQPLTPMMLDILAVQRLYGVSTNGVLDGNDTFGFNTNIAGDVGVFYDFNQNINAIATIWDSGTGNTLDLSGFSQDAVVNLAPGTFSSVGGHINNLGIAVGTVIETAIGGSGNDQITASNVNSTLQAGIGNDRLTGGAGDDDLQAQEGLDYLDGGAGLDTMSGGTGGDFFDFTRGEANGDTVIDFESGDTLQFFGYGFAADGATFTQLNATQWSVNSADGLVHETITFTNAPTIAPSQVTFLPEYKALDHSGYLDLMGYRITGETSVEDAYGFGDDYYQSIDAGFNVAIILDRKEDPTALLQQDWGTRQKTLEQLKQDGTLWTKYGADHAQYEEIRRELKDDYHLKILDDSNASTEGNYVSSAEARTIWVHLETAEEFNRLFQTTLYYSPDGPSAFWLGNLRLPEEWDIKGLWFDTSWYKPDATMLADGSQTLTQGPLGIGNASPNQPDMVPNLLAGLYNFPLNNPANYDDYIKTSTIGLIEPGIGSALSTSSPDPSATYQAALKTLYLDPLGITGDGKVHTQGVDGQSWAAKSGSANERSLDIGVVAAVNPNSDIVLYNGSGQNGDAHSSIFSATQSAIWDKDHDTEVISSSYNDSPWMDPRSPFYRAYWELYVDGALKNKTIFNALGDLGSGYDIANGLTNLDYNVAYPYTVLVGGTSISSSVTAPADPSLFDQYWLPALAGDLSTIWRLVAGGLSTLPTSSTDLPLFMETVWNQYFLKGIDVEGYSWGDFYTQGFQDSWTSSGGVDPSQPTPWYQTQYGLSPVTSDPWAQSGRGVPDVTANAGGNLNYTVPNGEMTTIHSDGGTSAASPFWAALAAQINTIFRDQGLPILGFMNDLLYLASVIAPGSFNDVSVGGNTSSYYDDPDGPYYSEGWIQPTGYGYTAGYGYDYVSGLGSPNGLLLARTLTAIAHRQMYSTSPDMLEQDGDGGWTSGANQSLLFQTMSNHGGFVGVDMGGDSFGYTSGSSASFAWTSQFAQQSLQANFDPALVILFDKHEQGAEAQWSALAGQSLSVSFDGSEGEAKQALLSSPFGFADFFSDGGVVRVARAVAVAETAGGLDDQTAIVRVRQGGQNDLAVAFYKVDDLAGTIKGVAPGQADYAHKVTEHLYQLSSGAWSLMGPGYGNFAQAELLNVDAGDMIAMTLFNATTGNSYYAFSQANPDGVGHIWNYGLNTYGYEDTYGGGDKDYNDLVVQLDFTSKSGHDLLVG